MAADEGVQHSPDSASAGVDAGVDPAATDWLPAERISWFPIPDEEALDPRVAELVARQRQKLGAPNNVVRVHAWRPDLMLRWLEFQDYITKGPSELSRVEREMIAVVVSAENRCLF
jgi:alkylhydroperoxidase family enzyme